MSARVVVLALVALGLVACGGGVHAANTDSDAPADAGAGDGADDAGEALPPGVAYVSGGVKCCAKGIGRQCCVPGDGLCDQYGGFGACTAAGGAISGKDYCTICCDGLEIIGRIELVNGACVSSAAPDDRTICAACGDGECDAAHGENVCNCPKDCH